MASLKCYPWFWSKLSDITWKKQDLTREKQDLTQADVVSYDLALSFNITFLVKNHSWPLVTRNFFQRKVPLRDRKTRNSPQPSRIPYLLYAVEGVLLPSIIACLHYCNRFRLDFRTPMCPFYLSMWPHPFQNSRNDNFININIMLDNDNRLPNIVGL